MTWTGGSFGESGTCVLAPNANFMTLDGTNTWVLRDPDRGRSVVVDPGPSIVSHLDAIDEVAGDLNGLRAGTPEAVRIGMSTADMPTLAGFIARGLNGDASVADEVTTWRSGFSGVHYTAT